MSFIKSEDRKKWINALLAIVAILVGVAVIRFLGQMSEWFDLEAKVGNFKMIAQAAGILFGLTTFIAINKSNKASTHLNEVYDELVKVIWPENESIVKATIAVVIALIVVSGIFVSVDFTFRKLLELVY